MQNLDTHHKTAELTDAFNIFNQLSQNLVDSYRGLEEQVAKLTRELTAARSARLKTLIEKEKLALRLQSILAALPAAVVVLNEAECVVEYNPMAEEFFAQALDGVAWQTLVQRCLRPVADNPHEWQLSNGKRLSLTRSVLDNRAGQLVLLTDVSELRSLQDLLSRRQQLSAMGEMMASMAHQIRTPLSTAILYTSQLSKPTVNEAKRQIFAVKILERLHHLDRQVNDMLLFAKEGRLEMESFSLTTLLARITDAMDELLRHGSYRFTLHNQVSSDLLLGNSDALQGAMMNLLANAVDALAGAGHIELHVQQSQNNLLIKVIDDGPGMDAAACAQIFEPFYTTKVNGMGLGLAVVASVVQAHGGEIACNSTLGQGTVFTLSLPLLPAPAQALASSLAATVKANKEVTYATV